MIIFHRQSAGTPRNKLSPFPLGNTALKVIHISFRSAFPRTVRDQDFQVICDGFMVGEFGPLLSVIDFTACVSFPP